MTESREGSDPDRGGPLYPHCLIFLSKKASHDLSTSIASTSLCKSASYEPTLPPLRHLISPKVTIMDPFLHPIHHWITLKIIPAKHPNSGSPGIIFGSPGGLLGSPEGLQVVSCWGLLWKPWWTTGLQLA